MHTGEKPFVCNECGNISIGVVLQYTVACTLERNSLFAMNVVYTLERSHLFAMNVGKDLIKIVTL